MATTNEQGQRIAARLKAAREQAGFTQQQLSDALGFENRQTLAAIEAGDRRLAADELIAAVDVLGVDLDYFTDSFRLVGEGRFSFRAHREISPQVLDQFEERAGKWIATYRELGAQQGEPADLLEFKLALHSKSSFEDAQSAAESLVRRWELGATPALTLTQALEQHLRALILHVHAPAGISGAASQLPGLNTVLVNRTEPEGRRNYNVAHEVFHLLTWDAMPPDRIETEGVSPRRKPNRVEQLAENFASALLMPADAMLARWQTRDAHADLHDWLNTTAAELRVSGVACKWRLHSLGLLNKADLVDINDQRLAGPATSQSEVKPFSERFVKRIAVALDSGRLSTKRAASLLAISLADLADLLRSYGFEPAFEA